MDDEEYEELSLYLAVTFSEQAVRDGHVDVEGKTDEEIREALADWLRAIAQSDEPFEVQHDHGTTLVSEAVKYQQAGQYDLAIILAATQMEHWLNYMILWASTRRRNMAWSEARQVVRANLHAKTGWVWRLLLDDPIPAELVTRILVVADRRNAFVHYKWDSFDPDADDGSDEQAAVIAADALQLIEDLKGLEDQIVFYGKRAVIARVLAQVLGRRAEDPLT